MGDNGFELEGDHQSSREVFPTSKSLRPPRHFAGAASTREGLGRVPQIRSNDILTA